MDPLVIEMLSFLKDSAGQFEFARLLETLVVLFIAWSRVKKETEPHIRKLKDEVMLHMGKMEGQLGSLVDQVHNLNATMNKKFDVSEGRFLKIEKALDDVSSTVKSLELTKPKE